MASLSIDIETYSDEDLGAVGVYKYADSPNFKILLFAYAVNDSDVLVVDLEHGEEIPVEIENMLFSNEVVKTAFNAQFERVCLNKHFGRETKNWECTMIKAWMCGINGGLATVGDALNLAEDSQKLKTGKTLIKKFCTPQGKGGTDEEWNQFIEYNRQDVVAEIEIKKKLEKFNNYVKYESELYNLDQLINDNGVRIDIDMVNSAIKIDSDLYNELSSEYSSITGLDNPNSLKDIKDFIYKETGEKVSKVTKDNLDDLIEKFIDYPKVVRVLEIRKLLSKTSTAKYLKMKDTACSDGRSRGNLQFYGATHTGRWAGRLIQVQNLPQNHIYDLDIARKLVKDGDLEALKMAYDNPPDILSQCLRTAIIPDEGKKFLVADFSAIEARVTAWFANEKWRLDAFKDGKDIYCMSASKMFGVPVEKNGVNGHLRQKGKVAELACGFQGSSGALRAMGGEKMGLTDDEMKEIVQSWRRESPNIRDFWYEAQNSCVDAIKNAGSEIVFGYGRLKAKYIGGWLFITLPSGRSLSYAKAKIIEDDWGREQVGYYDRASSGSKWIEREIYGGKIVENIVQATARDCLAISMIRLHDAGYKIVMHVHDEVIIEIDESEDKLNDVLEIMAKEIPWAVGLPLTADGYECSYYMKD